MRTARVGLFVVVGGMLAASACGSAWAIVPFTERFDANASNWRASDGLTDLSWSAMGGPGGSAFVSGPFNFVNQAANATPIIYRGQTTYNSSGGAIFGDWRTDPVRTVSVDVRHNASVALTFFARFAPAGPGAVALATATVPAGEWRTLEFAIAPAVPPLIFEGPGVTYDTVFSNVSRVQFGVLVPQELAGVDRGFQFDLDNVAILPGAGVVAMVGMGLGVVGRRRRR